MVSMGLCKKDIANALKYVFLIPSHPYKECHLWITTPPHPPHPPHPLIISFNAMKSIWQCLKLFILFYQWSMYWAYNITLYCIATYREYHIGTVKFAIHNHFHHFQYLHRLLKSSLRCPVTQRWYCLALVCRVLIIPRWWGWTNIQLLKCPSQSVTSLLILA